MYFKLKTIIPKHLKNYGKKNLGFWLPYLYSKAYWICEAKL